jgi:hypothetical protein
MRCARPATLAIAAMLAGCWSAPTVDRSGPLYFEVEFVGEAPEGLDTARPAPFTTVPVGYRVRIRAIGHDQRPMPDWTGTVAIKADPGQLRSTERVAVEGGEAEARIQVALAFDELRFWICDEGVDASGGSFAVGVAPPIAVMKPTVADVQRASRGGDESALANRHVPLRGFDDPHDPRQLIVTAVVNDGFHVTDFDDPGGSFNSLFVFTFSRPEGVQVGDRLGRLAGIIGEFIGFTEMRFPSWTVESGGHAVGAAVHSLDPTIVCDDLEMEAWEAAPVELVDLVPDFRSAADCDDYLESGRWPARIVGARCGGAGARVSVVNANTVPSFGFARECDSQLLVNADNQAIDDFDSRYRFESLRGVVRHTAGADPPWVIDVRDCMDLPPDRRPGDCDQSLHRPMSGPRKAPDEHYRDVLTCTGVPYGLR